MKRLVLPGSVRAPRIRVRVSGSADGAGTSSGPSGATAALPGVVEAEVTSNNQYQADKFRLKIALNAPGGHDLDWWGADERKGALFDIRFVLDGDERGVMLGEADRIDVHPETGEIEIEGRDLSARLIDNQIQQAFQNKTSSEIVTEIAQRRGLTPVVTATSTKVERFYVADHDRVSHDQFSKASKEWDLLKWLSQQEGFDLYVKPGTRELHFEKQADASKAEPYGVKWDSDKRRSEVRKLRLERSLTLAKDVVVVVRSWHSGHGRSFSKSSPAGLVTTGGVAHGKAQRFVYVRPNLTEDQAQKLADSLRADITKHERRISFECPGELDLTVRDLIAVSGCGGWNQRYFLDTITRRVSNEGGFAMNVSGKNHFTESAVATP